MLEGNKSNYHTEQDMLTIIVRMISTLTMLTVQLVITTGCLLFTICNHTEHVLFRHNYCNPTISIHHGLAQCSK